VKGLQIRKPAPPPVEDAFLIKVWGVLI